MEATQIIGTCNVCKGVLEDFIQDKNSGSKLFGQKIKITHGPEELYKNDKKLNCKQNILNLTHRKHSPFLKKSNKIPQGTCIHLTLTS
jgi:hypothetical protein